MTKELKIIEGWKREFKAGIERDCVWYPAIAKLLLSLSTNIEQLLHQQTQLTRELTINECIAELRNYLHELHIIRGGGSDDTIERTAHLRAIDCCIAKLELLTLDQNE